MSFRINKILVPYQLSTIFREFLFNLSVSGGDIVHFIVHVNFLYVYIRLHLPTLNAHVKSFKTLVI